MKLQLINDLNESRMYRSRSSFKDRTARQVADHSFMDLIALWILYNEFEFTPTAIEYADRTAQLRSFRTYRQSATDLYHNLHIITQTRSDLLSSEADQIALDKFNVDERRIIFFLQQISRNDIPESQVRITLQRLEQSLAIEDSNYRSVRRLAQSWPTLTTSTKRVVLTRMLMFYRTNARLGDLFQPLMTLAKTKNLIADEATSPEISPAAKAAAIGAAGAAGYYAGYRLGKALT